MENLKIRNEKIQLNQLWLAIYVGTNLVAAGLLADSFDITKRQVLDPEKVKEQIKQFEEELTQQANPPIAQKAFQVTVKNTLRFLDTY